MRKASSSSFPRSHVETTKRRFHMRSSGVSTNLAMGTGETGLQESCFTLQGNAGSVRTLPGSGTFHWLTTLEDVGNKLHN